MSYTVYKNLNILTYPLVGNIDEYNLVDEENFFAIDRLNPELLSFLTDLGVNLENTFEIKKVDVSTLPENQSFTNGDYGATNQRTCTINWNFSSDTDIKTRYYSTDGATWTYDAQKNHTVWTNAQIQNGADWTSAGPILVDPQIPCKSISDSGQGFAIRVKLNFRETWESINIKLESVIIK